MHAVVVYESMFGNTRLIAEEVGAGLRMRFDVDVVPVGEAGDAVVADADLVVVGGPTHAHGMSRQSTRHGARDMAGKPDSGLELEPGATADGLRDWLGALGTLHAKAAAFDTRVTGPAALTGRASKRVGRELRRHGLEMVASPESFLVDRANRLVPAEGDRARAWGADLAARVVPAARPPHGGS